MESGRSEAEVLGTSWSFHGGINAAPLSASPRNCTRRMRAVISRDEEGRRLHSSAPTTRFPTAWSLEDFRKFVALAKGTGGVLICRGCMVVLPSTDVRFVGISLPRKEIPAISHAVSSHVQSKTVLSRTETLLVPGLRVFASSLADSRSGRFAAEAEMDTRASE